MAHLTGNFTSETPLTIGVREAIAAALAEGWADPKKLSQASHRAMSLQQAALEELASILQASPTSIEVLGEPWLLHQVAIGGFLSPADEFVTSAADVGKIRAISRSHQGPTRTLEVDSEGLIEVPTFAGSPLVSLQATNGETGVEQPLAEWRNLGARIVLDATRAIPHGELVEGFLATTFDAKSWGGPAGVGLIVINDDKNFNYPLPHIAPIRVPGSFSLPLLIGATVALSEYLSTVERVIDLRKILALQLKEVAGVTLVGYREFDSAPYLSVVVDQISSEELLRTTAAAGQYFDAGSACSPENLKPSHVIAAMGFPTTGHLRFTLHPEQSESEINGLVRAISESLTLLKR